MVWCLVTVQATRLPIVLQVNKYPEYDVTCKLRKHTPG